MKRKFEQVEEITQLFKKQCVSILSETTHLSKKRERDEEPFVANKRQKIEIEIDHLLMLKLENDNLKEIVQMKNQEVLYLQEQLNNMYIRPQCFYGLSR